MGCMALGLFISNPFKLINVWKKVSVMVVNTTHDTWVVVPNVFLILCWLGIGIVLLALWWWRKKEVLILLVLLQGLSH